MKKPKTITKENNSKNRDQHKKHHAHSHTLTHTNKQTKKEFAVENVFYDTRNFDLIVLLFGILLFCGKCYCTIKI